MKHRLLLVVIATLAAGSVALSACGDDQASSTTAVSSGGSAASSSTTTSSTTTTGGSMIDEGAPSNPSSTTTTAGGSTSSGDAISTAAVQAVVDGQSWAGQIGRIGVSPGNEQIITIIATEESVPAVEVCTTVRDAFVADHADVAVNVWFLSEQDPGGEGTQLATALSGSPCEAV